MFSVRDTDQRQLKHTEAVKIVSKVCQHQTSVYHGYSSTCCHVISVFWTSSKVQITWVSVFLSRIRGRQDETWEKISVFAAFLWKVDHQDHGLLGSHILLTGYVNKKHHLCLRIHARYIALKYTELFCRDLPLRSFSIRSDTSVILTDIWLSSILILWRHTLESCFDLIM